MNKSIIIVFIICICVVGLSCANNQIKIDQEKKGVDVDQKYKWDLKEIYPDLNAWKKDKESFLKKLPALKEFEGKLGGSANNLLQALDLMFDLKKQRSRISAYAMFLSDLDTRVAENQALVQEADTLKKKLDEVSAFIVPEILNLDQKKLADFLTSSDKLKFYDVYLKNIIRLKAHTRSPEVEKILAQSSQVLNATEKAYDIFSDANMPSRSVTLSSGEKIVLDKSGYVRYRAITNKEDRYLVFKEFWENYQNYEATFGSLLYGELAGHVFYKDVKGYESCLEASLHKDDIPVSVYHQLISDVHKNLPVFHRYLKMRKKMLGLETLTYDDMYVSLVKDVDKKYTVEQATDLVLKSLKPLGEKAVGMTKQAFDNNWVDFYPATGKRSGAYSEGTLVYDVHPFQLLNFTDDYSSVSTLAHEMGHGLHSYLTNQNQSFVYADYATFVAEVASTINEALLFKYMLANAQTDDERLSLLGQRLDDFRQTLFRQVLFAEFELKAHEMAENGVAITGESMSALYLKLLRKYYGHDVGVTQIDDLYGIEWAYIPHFYYNFYVFTYATSLTASTDIARRIIDDEVNSNSTHKERDAYLKMISLGNYEDPISLLKIAGVDMTTSQPFNAAMQEMNELMDEIEKILDKKK